MAHVSIVIPAHEARAYIREAVASALNQTHPDCEVIVVDDGSDDGTPEWVRYHFGGRITLIEQKNQGPSAARNTGIRAATGDFVQFCDADDIMAPQQVARCLEQFTPQVAVVHCGIQAVQADGETPEPAYEPPPLWDGDVFCDLLHSNSTAILPSTALVRRPALLNVGLFREDLRNSEDWDLFLRLAARYPFASVDAPLLRYRIHDHNLSRDRYQAALGRLRVLQYARDDPRRARCLPDADYDRLLAGRYHALAMIYWHRRQRPQARAMFQQALQLHPSNMRRLLWALTYIAPAGIADWLAR